jgi:hypothetical protein
LTSSFIVGLPCSAEQSLCGALMVLVQFFSG